MLMRLYFSCLPKISTFRELNQKTLPFFLRTQLYKNIFYTPYIQMKSITQELISHMKFLRRKKYVTNDDLRAFTDKIVLTYVNNYNQQHPEQPDCGYAVNYKCKPCPYGGIAQYLIYCQNNTKFVPILFIQGELNLPDTIAAAIWNLMNQKDANLHGYGIQTNGSKWQLARVTRDMHLEKTPVLEPKNSFQRAYQDQQFVQMTMGLIQQGLQLQNYKKEALITAYTYIDQKVDHFQLKEGQKRLKEPLIKRLLNRWTK